MKDKLRDNSLGDDANAPCLVSADPDLIEDAAGNPSKVNPDENLQTDNTPTNKTFDDAKSRIQLLDYQLKGTIPNNLGVDFRLPFRRGAVGLYASLSPKGPIESIIARLIVGATNTAMDCFGRAASTRSEPAHSLNVQSGLKSASLSADLLEKFASVQNRRNQPAADLTADSGRRSSLDQDQSKPRRLSGPRRLNKVA